MNPIRIIAERLSRHVVLKRRLPLEYGGAILYVTPASRLNLWHWNLSHADLPLLRLVKETVRTGAVVWDVGANVGLFAFAAAGLAGVGGRVVAIDADPWLCSLMERSARIKNPNRATVDVVSAAIFNTPGVSEFIISNRGRASNHLAGFGTNQTGGVRDKRYVPTLTLDTFLTCFPPPAVLKIDVECAEGGVLEGAKQLLNKHRPVIICEVSSSSSNQVTALLSNYGYVLYDGEVEMSHRVPLTAACWNTLALPGHLTNP